MVTVVYIIIIYTDSAAAVGPPVGLAQARPNKDILVFSFSFNLNLSFKDIKVKNM